MLILLSIPAAFLLDLLLGDPEFFPHPVVLMGKCITSMEAAFRKWFPKNPKGEFFAGLLMAILLPVGTLLLTSGILLFCYFIHPALFFAVQTFWNYQALAIRGLHTESMAVFEKLQSGSLPAARAQLSRIVGRDTDALDQDGVTRGAVETVAENFSDGVVAPLFYMMLGGASLALTYKAINTMDSMCGYKNERYLFYGRSAARLDDIANFLPSRLAALLMILTAALLPNKDGRGALRIWKRDRRKHESPNSAQTESACAGALGISLAGNASYFGKVKEKPVIGDAKRPIEPEDIVRANTLMICGSILSLLVMLAIRGGGLLFFYLWGG